MADLGLVGPLPPPNGGMAMQTQQLARLLAREGRTVVLEPTNAPYRPAIVASWRGLRAVFRLLPYFLRVWRLAGQVPVIHVMANSGWSWQLFTAPVVWIGRLRKTPVIVNYRGGEAREYLARSVRRVRPTLNRAAALVVPSGFLAEVFAEHGFDAQIIPNIIDLETFCPGASRAGKQGFTLVVTRNLEALYGIDVAIRALAIVAREQRDVQLRIAGSGPEQQALAALAAELGVAQQVSFAGRLDRPEVVALYREADAALNPSRVDNMPNSVLEALACGVPVISTRVGGVPFIVEHGRTALLVEPDDPEAMAQAIMALRADSALQRNLTQAGLACVAQYSWDRVREQWLGLYERLGNAA